nr:prepilin-type N-terminal cleavage/methylation domain-containing protein [Thalassotalea sp. G2M2-11]
MNYKSVVAKNHKGFTLIEVLVAAMILFSSLAIISVIYRSALIASDKAEKHVNIANIVPNILTNVQLDIRSQANQDNKFISGKGADWGAEYSWSANLIDYKSPLPVYDIDTGNFTEKAKKYKYWQVSLIVFIGKTQQQFSYNEVSWNDS